MGQHAPRLLSCSCKGALHWDVLAIELGNISGEDGFLTSILVKYVLPFIKQLEALLFFSPAPTIITVPFHMVRT